MKINELVQKHFKTIELENGTGFFQALATDNLILDEENGKEKFQLQIDKDKLYGNDWNKLVKYLKENEIDLFPFSFMDEKGIIYIIPVLLVLELKNELNTLFNMIILL